MEEFFSLLYFIIPIYKIEKIDIIFQYFPSIKFSFNWPTILKIKKWVSIYKKRLIFCTLGVEKTSSRNTGRK